MRLVIDGQRLTAKRTGVGRCLESLLADWAETGWPLEQTLLVGCDSDGLRRVSRSAGLETKLIGEGWPGLVWETLGLGRLLRDGDLLFAPANLVPWTWRGKTVAVIYDTLPWSSPTSFPWHVKARFGWRYRLAARRSDQIIVPSEATARDVARVHGVSVDRIRVIYPGPEPRFRPLDAGSLEVMEARRSVGVGCAPFFLFVGKRSKRRNVGAVLEAFEWQRKVMPELKLVFVGPEGGEGIPLEEAGVINAGHVDEATLLGLYASAIALLYPSDHEGFGLPVIEAQACGCPVVTLRNSALVESGGDAAWYLESAAPEEMLGAFETLASDAEKRCQLVALGLANARRFSREVFAREVKGEIQRVAGSSIFQSEVAAS